MQNSQDSAKSYQGKEAQSRFAACVNSFFQDDAIGNAYCVTRNENKDLVMTRFTGCGFEGVVLDFEADIERLHRYEMIVIDSGNAHGDSWIATFYPKQMILSFVDEYVDQESETVAQNGGHKKDMEMREKSSSRFDGLFDDAFNGLREFDQSLTAESKQTMKEAVIHRYVDTGNNQADYEHLRDAIESEIALRGQDTMLEPIESHEAPRG